MWQIREQWKGEKQLFEQLKLQKHPLLRVCGNLTHIEQLFTLLERLLQFTELELQYTVGVFLSFQLLKGNINNSIIFLWVLNCLLPAHLRWFVWGSFTLTLSSYPLCDSDSISSSSISESLSVSTWYIRVPFSLSSWALDTMALRYFSSTSANASCW